MRSIVDQFEISTPVGDPQQLHVGIINDSFKVPAERTGDPSFFLQRINHHIFTDVDALQQNIVTVTEHLRNKMQSSGIKEVENRVLRLVPTHDGKWYFKTPNGEYWRMYNFIEGSKSYERVTPDSAYLAGEAFGEFQTMLSDLPFEKVAESIPNFHNIEHRLRQLLEAIENDSAGRVGQTRNLIGELTSRATEMCRAEELYRAGKLPKRINHCDTKVNNVLFDKEGRPLCIVDLDTVMPGYVLSDFGDFMRTAACTAAEDEQDLSKIHVDREIYQSYSEGYLRKATFLTELERELLPFGCRLMSYMQSVRFLTDYLNGDTYYKISYIDHNLVRAKAQLQLLKEQERVLR